MEWKRNDSGRARVPALDQRQEFERLAGVGHAARRCRHPDGGEERLAVNQDEDVTLGNSAINTLAVSRPRPQEAFADAPYDVLVDVVRTMQRADDCCRGTWFEGHHERLLPRIPAVGGLRIHPTADDG